ncbi:hypothetical protein ACVWWR_003887 [Bradyrhizobium sp. LM3.2]
MAVSSHVPAKRAAKVPNRMPSISEIANAVSVSNSVAGSRSRISFDTGACWRKEKPRSSVTTPLT